MNLVHQIIRPAVAPPLVATMDWVMEPEVPRPTGKLLDYPTSRCFMEDRIDARFRLGGHAIEPTDRVDFDVRTTDGNKLVFISTDTAAVNQIRKDYHFAHQRSLKTRSNVLEASENESASSILFDSQVSFPVGGSSTSLMTSVYLPALMNKEFADIYFTVSVNGSVTLSSDRSPLLKAFRWWADPARNLGQPKTNASKIEPIVDGEAFFNRVLALIASATKYIYIFSWSFWMDMFLTGEPSGGGTKLSDTLRAAEARGVKIYILLDSANGGWASDLLARHLNLPNLYFRTIDHYRQLLGQTIGTYHEKYLCVDGKTAVVGGIDFMPDRYNNPRHEYKSDNTKFQAQEAALGAKIHLEAFKTPFSLWHDVAVLVEGSVVANVEHEFVRLWNFKVDRKYLLSSSPIQQAQGDHNVQVVKTAHIESQLSLPPPPDPQPGTFDAYKQAIDQARHYIYIENQYLRHAPLGDLLVKALEARPTLSLMAVIPFRTEESVKLDKEYKWEDLLTWIFKGAPPQDIRDRMAAHGDYLQAQLIERLRKISNAANRVGIYSLAGALPASTQAEQIYPHSKLMIVDDTWAIIGSANTNGRGLKSDSELSIVVHRREQVAALRKALWKEHLGIELDTRDIRKFFAEWQRVSLPARDKAKDCSVSEVRTVHAVKLGNPPKGQKYNGPLSIADVDDEC